MRDWTITLPALLLHWAARGNDLPVLALLVERGADLNLVDNGGAAPLHSLASRGNLDGIRLLLDKGAEINLPSADGATALHLAALGRQVEAIRLLVARKADVDRANLRGRTPLILAAREMSGPAVVAALLECGADIDARTVAGQSAFNVAGENADADIAALLAAKGADEGAARFPELRGKYLGQRKPGRVPEIFAPGIVSSRHVLHSNLDQAASCGRRRERPPAALAVLGRPRRDAVLHLHVEGRERRVLVTAR